VKLFQQRSVCALLLISQRSNDIALRWKTHLRATGSHSVAGITHCYLPPNTSEHARPNSSQKERLVLNLPTLEDGRLSYTR